MLQFAFYFHLLGNTVLQLLVFAQILDAFILIVRSQLIAHLPKTLFDMQKFLSISQRRFCLKLNTNLMELLFYFFSEDLEMYDEILFSIISFFCHLF